MELKSFSEQRVNSRDELMFHTEIFDCATGLSIGVLCDISLIGLRVAGEHGVPPGEKLQLRVVVPDDSPAGKEIVFYCQSRWSHRDPASDCFYIGFQLLEIDEDQRSLLESLIEEYGFGGLLKD
jgi:hypothetical protein